jgi:NAD+ synthase (glutamine-hydrolysing)
MTKTSVYKLSHYINSKAGREIIPQNTLTKPPSAELRPDQKDEDSLPPYDLLDQILELYVEKDYDLSSIVKIGYDVDVVKKIISMVDNSEYKRRQGPPGVKITPKAFGKDRRIPITNNYRDNTID